VTDPKKIGIDSLLPGGKGTITVSSDESDLERQHRLEQSAKDQELTRKHDGLDKDQARRHNEVDYWTVRAVLVLVIFVAIWLLNKSDTSESAVRFAWGLIGSVIGAILGLLKGSAGKK
jgi:hypothetical protein